MCMYKDRKQRPHELLEELAGRWYPAQQDNN